MHYAQRLVKTRLYQVTTNSPPSHPTRRDTGHMTIANSDAARQTWTSVRRAALVLFAGVVLSACGEDSAQLDSPLSECRLTGLIQSARCGMLTRPENPQQPGGRSIEVHYAVVPALARNRLPDAIFILAGGPGQAARDLAATLSPLFAKLNQRRDLVFIDQRGTGASHPFACEDLDAVLESTDPMQGAQTTQPTPDDAERIQRALKTCLQNRETDPRQYTTSIAVGDFDAVRAVLGYPQVNLWGASYGTRVALEYLRQYPERIRSAVLDGVSPATMRLPLAYAQDADAALQRLINDCRADVQCANHFPNLASHIDALFARLKNGPITLSLNDARTGQPRTLQLSRVRLASWLRNPLYLPLFSSLLPHAVTRAAANDFAPLAALASLFEGNLSGKIDVGMHLSVVCSEDLHGLHGSDDASLQADLAVLDKSRFGRGFYEQYQLACANWPAGTPPSGFFVPVAAKNPVLMLSGGLDPATPPRHAERAARSLPESLHLIAARLGHGVSSQGCAPQLIEQFIREGHAQGIDGACLAVVPRPEFFVAPDADAKAKQ